MPLVEPRHVFLDVDVRLDGGDRRAELGELLSVERSSGGLEVCNRHAGFRNARRRLGPGNQAIWQIGDALTVPDDIRERNTTSYRGR